MSQQENPQDNQENPPLGEAGSWSTPPASNRPAEGATRLASLHQAEQTWRAGEGATDFLGLEQDNPLETAPLAPAQTASAEAAPEVNPTQAWLFHMENASAGAQAPAADPSATTAPEWSAESLLDGQDTAPIEADAQAQDAPAPADAVALADEALLDAPAPASVQAPVRKRKVQWLVAAGLAATLLAAGGWQLLHEKSKSNSPTDALVWRSGNKPSKPVAKNTPKTSKPVEEAPKVAVQPPLETPPVDSTTPPPAQPDPKPVEVAGADAAPKSAPETQTSTPGESPVVPPVEGQGNPEALAQAQTPAESTPPDFTPVAFGGVRPEDPTEVLATPKGVRRPEASEIAGMWTSREIPTDAIAGQSVTRTPLVGGVRVLLKNGEHMQGRLHSVGQGQISLDVALGRMSIDYDEVGELIQIPEGELSKKPSNGLPEETAGLMYVTAKVPGGNLTGWLVQRAGGKLTLITEQAKRVTFEDEGFEPVSKGRARVVGTIGRNTTEAVSPVNEPDRSVPKLKSGKNAAPAKPAPAKPAPAKPAPAKPKG